MDKLGRLIRDALAELFQSIRFPLGWNKTSNTEKKQEETK